MSISSDYASVISTCCLYRQLCESVSSGAAVMDSHIHLSMQQKRAGMMTLWSKMVSMQLCFPVEYVCLISVRGNVVTFVWHSLEAEEMLESLHVTDAMRTIYAFCLEGLAIFRLYL
jgi:hypothetical protein